MLSEIGWTVAARYRRGPAEARMSEVSAMTQVAKPQVPEELVQGLAWRDASDPAFTVNGLPWFEENGRTFLRFPKRAQSRLREPVWQLSLAPSGGRVRFATDSGTLRLIVHHAADIGSLHMVHFCAVGMSGIDLYEGPPERMTFWCASRPAPADIKQPYLCEYLKNLPRRRREFTLYLPTYVPLASLRIGLDPDATVGPPSPFRLPKPILVYGTSITQGGCASRGGNGFVPLVGRRLGVDVVNLGFSGNGKNEPEVAELIAEVDAACYVVDSAANNTAESMAATLPPFISILRAARPTTPIVLMTRIHYANESFSPAASNAALNRTIFDQYHRMLEAGDQNVHLFDSAQAIGLGGNHPSVDGCHLTDEGFRILGEALAPVLARVTGLIGLGG